MELNNNIVSYDGNQYNIIHQTDGNILLQKINIINITSINDIKKYNFNKSIISKCIVNNDIIYKYKYKYILNYVYNLIDNGAKIIRHTTLNIDTRKREDSGFYYLDDLSISVQGSDANKCLYEICHQCIINKLIIHFDILLDDGNQINIKL